MIERYTLPEIGAVWTEEAKYRAWLEVELAVCRARAELGGDPDRRGGRTGREGELHRRTYPRDRRETNHDVIAFVTNVAEYAGTSPVTSTSA